MSVGTGWQNIIILFWKQQFHLWEYINGIWTFTLDSYPPFIFRVMQKPVFTERKLDTLPNLHKIQYRFLYLLEVAESRSAPSDIECKEEQTYVPFSGNGKSYHLHDS